MTARFPWELCSLSPAHLEGAERGWGAWHGAELAGRLCASRLRGAAREEVLNVASLSAGTRLLDPGLKVAHLERWQVGPYWRRQGLGGLLLYASARELAPEFGALVVLLSLAPEERLHGVGALHAKGFVPLGRAVGGQGFWLVRYVTCE